MEQVDLEELRKRRRFLLKLINDILAGNIDSSRVPLDEMYQLHSTDREQITGPRKEYISPLERSTTNYGYMNSFEVTDDLRTRT